MENLDDTALRHKGLHVLIRELGEVDTMRFLSQISHETKNYLAFQEKLFANMSVSDIYARAKAYADKKRVILETQESERPHYSSSTS